MDIAAAETRRVDVLIVEPLLCLLVSRKENISSVARVVTVIGQVVIVLGTPLLVRRGQVIEAARRIEAEIVTDVSGASPVMEGGPLARVVSDHTKTSADQRRCRPPMNIMDRRKQPTVIGTICTKRARSIRCARTRKVVVFAMMENQTLISSSAGRRLLRSLTRD